MVTIGILGIAFWAGKLAKKSLEAAEKVKTYQFLTDIISNYSSAEMLLAVRTLWEFHREIKKRLEDTIKKELLEKALWEEYDKIRKQDECEIKLQQPERRLAREKTTLHHYRRIVSNFYELLAGIHKEEVIKKEIIFNYWNKENLSIIPKIIIPIEVPLFKHLYPGAPLPEKINLMRSLYCACLKYKSKKNVSPQD